MRSDIIKVSASGKGVRRALEQTEAVAVFKGLSRREGLWLRLLAEEMMGMLRGLTGEVDAEFYIEDEENDFRLHLITETIMDAEKRRKLLESSTEGKNAAAVGVMGKLRNIVDRFFEPACEGVSPYVAMGWIDQDVDLSGCSYEWSLMQYKACVERDNAKEEWDELEKSIVANIADEIKIFIRGGRVEMVIYKKF